MKTEVGVGVELEGIWEYEIWINDVYWYFLDPLWNSPCGFSCVLFLVMCFIIMCSVVMHCVLVSVSSAFFHFVFSNSHALKFLCSYAFCVHFQKIYKLSSVLHVLAFLCSDQRCVLCFMF